MTFALGTDAGFAVTPYGEWHARELELLMEYAGLSPLEAIQAATANNAVTLGMEGEVGELAPGALADVLVVGGDPTRDIRVLQRPEAIEVIVKGGQVVERAEVERRSIPTTGTSSTPLST